jgi:prepilin-type processing-associated H-X9-DG protein
MALHTYQGTFGLYPCSLPVTGTDQSPGGRFFSPFVQLLPYIEQGRVFNAINFIGGAANASDSLVANSTAMHAVVELLLCPSDPAPSVRRFGPISYRVNMGATVNPLGEPQHYVKGLDVWTWLRPADFVDGLSTTAALSEKPIGNLDVSRLNRFTQHIRPVPGPDPPSPSWVDEGVANCRQADPHAFELVADGGATWFLNGFGETWYAHASGPNPEFLDCSFHTPFALGILGAGVFAARSYHNEGVNVLMMDGSVRFVTDAVDLSLWRAISTRAGGEPIDATF